VEKVGELGSICDLGCGPGHVARFLRDRGADVCGIDLSPEMVRQAALLHSDINFTQGDMLRLDRVSDASFGGVAAFYSVIHIPRPAVVGALAEALAVMTPLPLQRK